MLLVFGPVVLAGAATAQPAHLRGPDYSGRVDDTGVQLPWSSPGPTVLWRRELGEGFSGAVVAGERIFTQMQTLAGQFVICLDRQTGRELWRGRTNWPWQPGSRCPGPYATPTVAGGRVYFADCFGRAGCLEASTGRLHWSVDLAKELGAELPGFGYAATPLVEQGKVYLPAGGKGRAVVALNAIDGSLVWQAGDGLASYSSSVSLEVDGRPVVLTILEDGPLALDPASGRVLWQRRWTQASDHHGTWPLYADSLLFHGRPFRDGAEVHRLTRDGDALRGELLWSSRVLSLDILSGVMVGGRIYAFDVHDLESAADRATGGVLKCVELATGRECWRSDRTGHCSVIAAGNRLIMLNEGGELIVAEATPVEYRELARATLFHRRACWAPMTVTNGLLLLRGGNEIVAVTLLPNAIPGSPAPPVLASTFSDWMARNYRPTWFAPAWPDQVAWFLACVLGVLLPAGLVAAFLPCHAWLAWSAWLAGALALAVAAPFPLTAWTGRILLTWPAGLFLGLAGVVGCRAWAREHPSRARIWCARAALLVFGSLALGFWLVCRSVFFFAGGGWVAGLLPALPFTVAAIATVRNGGPRWKAAGWALAGFGLFFWTSALVVWWRTAA